MQEMRRQDRQLSEEEGLELLKNAEWGLLSTVCPDGTPYGIPLSFALEGREIYIHCARAEGQKIINIRGNSSACFTAVDSVQFSPETYGTLYRSAMAFGRAEVLEDEDGVRRGLMAILNKYYSPERFPEGPKFMEGGMKFIEGALDKVYIIKFTIETLTCKGRKQ